MMNLGPVPVPAECRHCGDPIRSATPAGSTEPPGAFEWVHVHTQVPWCAAATHAEPVSEEPAIPASQLAAVRDALESAGAWMLYQSATGHLIVAGTETEVWDLATRCGDPVTVVSPSGCSWVLRQPDLATAGYLEDLK